MSAINPNTSHTYEIAALLEEILGDPYDFKNPINIAQAIEWDEHSVFPEESIQVLRDIGLFEFFIPHQYGGKLTNAEQLIGLCRVLARRDLTVAIAIGQTFLGALPVWFAGNESQIKHLIACLRQGDLGCLALTEKAHGSDLLSIAVSAQQTSNGFVLNGEKWLINNATQGRTLSVLVRKFGTHNQVELGVLLIDKMQLQGGFKPLEKIATHGIRGADISGIEFSNCHVNSDCVLSKHQEPSIFSVFKALQVSRILCAGFSLGALDTALRTTLKFVRERTLYAKPLLSVPSVQNALAIQYVRMLLVDAVACVSSRAVSTLPAQLSVWSAVTKYFVPVTTEQAIHDLKVVLGARYYLRNEFCAGVFQKLARDNEVVSLFDGSTQVNLNIIASQLYAVLSQLVANSANDQRVQLDCLLSNQSTPNALFVADQFQLSNKGLDPLMAWLYGFASCHTHQELPLLTTSLEKLLTIKQKLDAFIAQECQAYAAGDKNPHSVARFNRAKTYTVLFALAAFLYVWASQHAVQQKIKPEVVDCLLDYVLLSMGLIENHTFAGQDAVIDLMMMQFETNELFSIHECPIASSDGLFSHNNQAALGVLSA